MAIDFSKSSTTATNTTPTQAALPATKDEIEVVEQYDIVADKHRV